MRHLSFRPALTMRGRKFFGLRGWSGKPLHPPLTDVPIGAYTLAVVFDLISAIGHSQLWARDFYRAATFSLVAGAVVSVFAALTGFVDRTTSEAGTQARRTVNAHAVIMVAVSVVALADIVVRRFVYWTEPSTTGVALALTLAVGVLMTAGGTIGGSITYQYGFNVETAGDSPVWHKSEADVAPDGTPL